MPELPEVETIRRDLSRVLRGQVVERVNVRKGKMVSGSTRSFVQRLKGKCIQRIRRRGKLLIFAFEDESDLFLLIHLKMTGQLVYEDHRKTVGGGHGFPLVEALPNAYSHIIFSFQGGGQLYFNDMRQFGFVRLVNAKELKEIETAYGVEPLTRAFSSEVLQDAMRGRVASLKSVLLNQSLIAGLGNIYVDEACFRAGVRPMRRANKVTQAERKRLYVAIVEVLREAIRSRGTTFGSYRDGMGGEGKFVRKLQVYGRGGKECLQCGQLLKRVVVGQRGTVYCPHCQT